MGQEKIDFYKRRSEHKWVRVVMSSLDPIDEKGEIATSEKAEREMRLDAWSKVLDEKSGGLRFGPFKDAEDAMVKNFIQSFEEIFASIQRDKGNLFTALKNQKIRIGIENLFPSAPERGYMQGFAYFYSPEHIANVIKEIRKTAEMHGIPADVITTTFDVAHAAAASHVTGLTPSQFIDELKKKGVKVEYSHLVGGTGYGHGHIAWGDWLDEVSRMDPGVIEKLMNVGAINIEGGQGLYDTEVTLNTLWDRGLPLEAIMAMAGGPSASLDWGGYSGFSATPYNRDMLSGYAGSSMPIRSFYSFQEGVVPSPMKDAFGSYTMPARFGGGYGHGPGRTSAFWVSSQPLLYSSKSGGGEET
jgi:hypothetical protein